jgi:hypothetical protein
MTILNSALEDLLRLVLRRLQIAVVRVGRSETKTSGKVNPLAAEIRAELERNKVCRVITGIDDMVAEQFRRTRL